MNFSRLSEVKEVDLFKAVDRWATKELERREKTGRKIKRKILGEEIVKAFPASRGLSRRGKNEMPRRERPLLAGK